MIAANIAAYWFLWKENPLGRSFWGARLREIRSAATTPAVFIYAVMLLLCTQAAAPDISSDGVRIHLGYAYEWFLHGHIFADPRFRFPYYQFNQELIFVWMFVAGVGRYIPFLGWLSGAVSALGVYALIATIDEGAQAAGGTFRRAAANVVYVVLPLSLALCPTVLRWTGTAMEDATAGLVYLAAVGAIVLLTLKNETRYTFIAVLCVAFLAGMKPSYVILVPAAAIFIAVVLHKRVPSKTIVGYALLLLVLASPWYVRNIIFDGDPIPPVFNLRLHGVDPAFTADQWAQISADLRTPLTPQFVASYPSNMFFSSMSQYFREYGLNVLIFALYPILVLCMVFLLRTKRTAQEYAFTYLLTWTIVGAAYVLIVSSLGRYSMLYYPTLAATAGTAILYLAKRVRFGMVLAPILALATLIPSSGANVFYTTYYQNFYTGLAASMPNDDAFLDTNLNGYLEAKGVFDAPVFQQPRYENVLLLKADIAYYVELHGGNAFGDWFGPGNYAALENAINANAAVAYMNQHDIGALIVGREGEGPPMNPLDPGERASLRQQLLTAGFREMPSSDAKFMVLERVPRPPLGK
jgi:hypothetical protein